VKVAGPDALSSERWEHGRECLPALPGPRRALEVGGLACALLQTSHSQQEDTAAARAAVPAVPGGWAGR